MMQIKHAGQRMWFMGLTFLLVLGLASPGQAQRPFQIGYVYPAGGQQGSTFEIVVAGQFLAGADKILVSGPGVQATITEMIRPMTGREINDIRIQIDELVAKRAVVMKDYQALEQFRSFRKAKTLPKDSTADDEQIAELKRKYANATWTREDERRLMELRRKLAMAMRRPATPAISELVIARMTIASDAPPGQRELRLATANGLSNPLPFYVSRLPEISEPAVKQIPEQRSAVAGTAAIRIQQPRLPIEVSLPCVINGQMLPGEVDRYQFTAKKGQRLVAVVQARDLIPYIADAVPGWFQATVALYDKTGKELAYVDDFRFQPDPVLYCEIPADGVYLLEIKDALYRGREDFVYRITLGQIPWVTDIFPLGGPAAKDTVVVLGGYNLPVRTWTFSPKDVSPGIYTYWLDKNWPIPVPVRFAVDTLPETIEQEPNNSLSQAQPLPVPQIVNGRIQSPEDEDVFRVEGKAGQKLIIEVIARRVGSPLDSLLKLADTHGRLLASSDDMQDPTCGWLTHYADSRIEAILPTDGAYYVHLRDAQHRSGPEYAYRLRISPPRPDFELRVVPSAINVRPAGSVTCTVYAVRKDGFNGQITLRLRDAPTGFRVSGGLIPAGQDQAKLTITAPLFGSDKPYWLQLEGVATVDGQQLVRPVIPAEDRMQAFAYHHLMPAQELCAAVIGREWLQNMVKIVTPGPIQIPLGGLAKVQIQMPPAPMFDRIEWMLEEGPEGITVKETTQTGYTTEVVLTTDPTKLKPGQKGQITLCLIPRFQQRPKQPAKVPIRQSQWRLRLPAIPIEIIRNNP
ncbi:MAG: PPC domain-containing protein [Thermoguttaceae bacterium]|nr:PPC domain-containing protein [Thermoguttaceae bacterium]MDW8039599.1 PPC domain-containing protein [Thermoguttaceae bacterium]